LLVCQLAQVGVAVLEHPNVRLLWTLLMFLLWKQRKTDEVFILVIPGSDAPEPIRVRAEKTVNNA